MAGMQGMDSEAGDPMMSGMPGLPAGVPGTSRRKKKKKKKRR